MTAPRPSLSPEDWIAAAFRRLAQGGLAAVRAEAIARDLGVSKGSFYWHFKDLPDLKARMLAHWLDRATEQVMALTVEGGGDATARLERLTDLASSDLSERYGGPRAELAIRDWARLEPGAGEAQRAADTARLAFLTGLLQQAGLTRAEAERGARQIYGCYLGAQLLAPDGAGTQAEDLRDLVARVLRR
ncbi:TetR/AcrR family transcriptional regulator [Pararhodobacter sp. CCB-MM2]|uniref:TetR/AcrR family transcriptional regulator n=1 Tax=Pararhodobacter sp. CCB-MM2 TaxID=1786003 RepID=UPI000834D32B|nr:TetR/AcrR family transcriptional regulator [Pararhodobacter sp. CCB-MM2]MCA2013029.1 TetR/AcrR family transcriptional regulator [Cereibacter sphaeroides]